jgi:hypothetical protein
MCNSRSSGQRPLTYAILQINHLIPRSVARTPPALRCLLDVDLFVDAAIGEALELRTESAGAVAVGAGRPVVYARKYEISKYALS